MWLCLCLATTFVADAGATVDELRRFGSWKSSKTAARYVHASSASLGRLAAMASISPMDSAATELKETESDTAAVDLTKEISALKVDDDGDVGMVGAPAGVSGRFIQCTFNFGTALSPTTRAVPPAIRAAPPAIRAAPPMMFDELVAIPPPPLVMSDASMMPPPAPPIPAPVLTMPPIIKSDWHFDDGIPYLE